MRVARVQSEGYVATEKVHEINHTARDERLVLYIGDAFDIVGEHKQTGYQKINERYRNYYYGPLARERMAKLNVGDRQCAFLMSCLFPVATFASDRTKTGHQSACSASTAPDHVPPFW